MLKEVADPAVRESLMQDLRNRGFDPETDKKLTFDVANPPRMPDGNPIVRVRCHMNQPGNRVLRPKTQPKTGVTLSNNHVAFVFENTDTGNWRIAISTRLDSFIGRGEMASKQRASLAEDSERFVFSLCSGDLLLTADDGPMGGALLRVRGLDGDRQRIWVQPSRESRPSEGLVRLTANGESSLRASGATKVIVTPDGQLRTNNE